MLISMMMPIQVVMIPQYVMFQQFGWAQSSLPLIVPAFFAASYGPFSIFLMMQFMQGIPKDLDEAATIDGCGKYSIFFRIIMPLVKPAIASAAIFAFYWKWDDFIGPLLYLKKPQNYTISMALRMMSDKDASTAVSYTHLQCKPAQVRRGLPKPVLPLQGSFRFPARRGNAQCNR